MLLKKTSQMSLLLCMQCVQIDQAATFATVSAYILLIVTVHTRVCLNGCKFVYV